MEVHATHLLKHSFLHQSTSCPLGRLQVPHSLLVYLASCLIERRFSSKSLCGLRQRRDEVVVVNFMCQVCDPLSGGRVHLSPIVYISPSNRKEVAGIQTVEMEFASTEVGERVTLHSRLFVNLRKATHSKCLKEPSKVFFPLFSRVLSVCGPFCYLENLREVTRDLFLQISNLPRVLITFQHHPWRNLLGRICCYIEIEQSY